MMRINRVIAMLMTLASLWGALAFAAPRIIAENGDMIASVSDKTGWCQDNVIVSIKAPTSESFGGDRLTLQRMLGQIRLFLEEECPQAKAVRIAGVVEPEGTVFLGAASKAAGWALTTGAPALAITASKPSEAPRPSFQPLNKTTDSAVVPIHNVIQMCDRLGAHPDDPEAFARGVDDVSLNAHEVISACESAIKHDKISPRLAFQLGRGYLKAEQVEDAIEQFIKAAKEGHGGALAYLGDIHLDGGPGIDPSPSAAYALYSKAAASGFIPANKMLEQFEDYTDRVVAADREEKQLQAKPNIGSVSSSSSGMTYINPDIIENLLRGDLDAVSNNEAWVKEYLVEVADSISQECKMHFTSADVKYLRTTAALTGLDMTPGGGFAGVINAVERVQKLLSPSMNGGSIGAGVQTMIGDARDADNAYMKLLEEAIKDSFVLMTKNKCGSQRLSSFSKSLTAYINNDDAPRQSVDQLIQSCQKTENKANSKEGYQFCVCIARKLIDGASMTRAERKGLARDFQGGAQRIIDKNKNHFRQCF